MATTYTSSSTDPVIQNAGALTSVSTSSSVFIAPVVGDLNVDANASITILNQMGVQMQYNDRYDIVLDLSDSCALLNCFDISGAGAAFDVMALHEAKFKEVMQKILDNATCTTTGGLSAEEALTPSGANVDAAGVEAARTGFTLHQTLNNQLLRLFKNIYTDGIANILQSNYEFSTSVNTAAAAQDMYDKLDANSQQAAEVIAQQIPNDNWLLYATPEGNIETGTSGENALTSALPMKVGDQLVFVFRTDETIEVTRGGNTEGSAADAINGSVPAGATPATLANPVGAAGFLGPYGNTLALSYNYNQRTIAFFVEIGNGNAAAGTTLPLTANDSILFPVEQLRGPHPSSYYNGEAGQISEAPGYGQDGTGGEVANVPVVDAAVGGGGGAAPPSPE